MRYNGHAFINFIYLKCTIWYVFSDMCTCSWHHHHSHDGDHIHYLRKFVGVTCIRVVRRNDTNITRTVRSGLRSYEGWEVPTRVVGQPETLQIQWSASEGSRTREPMVSALVQRLAGSSPRRVNFSVWVQKQEKTDVQYFYNLVNIQCDQSLILTISIGV